MTTFGVTGGIGMGKTTVAGILAQRGVAVVDTDDLARMLVRPGEPALEAIREAFGSAVFRTTQELNREALADVVFRDESARRQLESMLHPRIQKLWQAQLTAWRSEGRKQAAVVIPLLFETGVAPEFDRVVCIACSAQTQRLRLSSRGWSQEQIEQRVLAQMPVAEKMSRAHRVIWSEGDLDVLGRQCDCILATAV